MQVDLKEAYLEKIQKYFPEVNFESAILITKGWDNDVVILDEQLVFRFPKQEYYKDKLKAELQLLSHLSPKMPVPIPEYTYNVPGESFGGYTLVKGVEISTEVYQSFSEKDRWEVAKQLGECLSVMHDIALEEAEEFGFSKPDKSEYWWGPKHMTSALSRIREKVFPLLKDDEVEWVEHQFDKYFSLSLDFNQTLIHSDFTHDHLLFDLDKNRVSGIIDFSDSEISDPAMDFAGLWYFGEDLPVKVLKYYRHHVGEQFLERSKFPRLMHMVTNMLEIVEGEEIPTTIDECKQVLREVMESGLTL